MGGKDSRKSLIKSTEIRKIGNGLLLQKNRESYRKVLSLYTKSIAYAPLDSEELAQAYGNRSALWLHLHKYELCLSDIHKALDITKSNDLIQKLLNRKKECHNHLPSPAEDSIQEEVNSPKVTPSKSGFCSADSITMKCDEKYGRHYVATRDIKPGEIIVSEQTPYASIDIDQMYLICSHCLAFAWAGIPCDTCVFTIYCSNRCREDAWTQYHDILCIMLSDDTFHDRIIGYELERELQNPSVENASHSFYMTLLRMIIIIIKKDGLDNVIRAAEEFDKTYGVSEMRSDFQATSSCANFEFVYNLTTSKRNFDDSVTNLAPILLPALSESLNVLPDKYNDAFTNVLRKLFKICMANSLRFSAHDCVCKDAEKDDCISNRGDILAPCSALFNCSCDNNVDRIFVPGPRVILLTNRPIKKGEQLFITYGPCGSMKKVVRQALLKLLHSFTCECEPCIDDWPERLDERVTDAGLTRVTSEHYKLLGGDGIKLVEAPMNFSQRVFDTSLKMIEYVFENFQLVEATGLAHLYQRYVTRYLYHLHGEDVDLHHMNSIYMIAKKSLNTLNNS
ncbi:hypothetical protein QAD02_015604 [Eretmocerus hayati]|uniref:Uncharacterized protein n=1 Tax=Eretmocerus hayati TaxID=131215 RepID=A0ACC2P8R0_9HYME|nr:hypothetical protein QAD02_015604 [Eretmocerus hayati]